MYLREFHWLKILRKRGVGISEDSALKVDSNVLVKCRTGKRKPASEELDLDDDDEVVEDDDDIGLRKKRTRKRVDEVGSKIQLSTASKKRNRKATEVGDRDECLVSSPSEEDEELTVEDLMAIAHEYVKADEGNARQWSAAEKSEPTQLPVSFGFSRNDSGGSIEAIQSSKYFTVSMKERSLLCISRIFHRESLLRGAASKTRFRCFLTENLSFYTNGFSFVTALRNKSAP